MDINIDIYVSYGLLDMDINRTKIYPYWHWIFMMVIYSIYGRLNIDGHQYTMSLETPWYIQKKDKNKNQDVQGYLNGFLDFLSAGLQIGFNPYQPFPRLSINMERWNAAPVLTKTKLLQNSCSYCYDGKNETAKTVSIKATKRAGFCIVHFD